MHRQRTEREVPLYRSEGRWEAHAPGASGTCCGTHHSGEPAKCAQSVAGIHRLRFMDYCEPLHNPGHQQHFALRREQLLFLPWRGTSLSMFCAML
jgi:hypothetical protein